jgi:alpha/beta superfamily hydrolase
MHVTFPSGTLTLEGDLHGVKDATGCAVICHPHPQYGGDMDNSVVRAVASALVDSGHVTLRFNFRGVGASTGSYGSGVGEAEDLRAAVRFLHDHTAAQRVALAGYSFGAMVTLQAGPTTAAADRLIAVAPPLSFFSLTCVSTSTQDKLFIVGDRDQYCSVADLAQQLASVAEPKSQRIVRGADHFFVGHETALREAVRSFTRPQPNERSRGTTTD